MNQKVIFLSLLPLTATAVELDREPYLQGLNADSVTVVWRGTSSHSATVFYGENPSQLSESVASSSSLQHEVTLSGLSPATWYSYRVAGESGTLTESETYRFRTAPEIGSRSPFRFWVVGDSGTGGGAQYSVKDAMVEEAGEVLFPEDGGLPCEFSASYF